MGSAYENVNDAKEKLEREINAALADTGVWTGSTCPTGAGYGWDMNKHYALEWFVRHTPITWHISRIYRHECYDWTITEQ